MKYFSKKIKTPHGEFDSKAEYQRYLYLKHQEDIGVISGLQRQVPFEIIPKLIITEEVQLKTKKKLVEKVAERASYYTADFCYYNHQGQYVISECKGKYLKNLKDYVIRRKLIRHLIKKHNDDAGREDWLFEEYVTQ